MRAFRAGRERCAGSIRRALFPGRSRYHHRLEPAALRPAPVPAGRIFRRQARCAAQRKRTGNRQKPEPGGEAPARFCQVGAVQAPGKLRPRLPAFHSPAHRAQRRLPERPRAGAGPAPHWRRIRRGPDRRGRRGKRSGSIRAAGRRRPGPLSAGRQEGVRLLARGPAGKKVRLDRRRGVRRNSGPGTAAGLRRLAGNPAHLPRMGCRRRSEIERPDQVVHNDPRRREDPDFHPVQGHRRVPVPRIPAARHCPRGHGSRRHGKRFAVRQSFQSAPGTTRLRPAGRPAHIDCHRHAQRGAKSATRAHRGELRPALGHYPPHPARGPGGPDRAGKHDLLLLFSARGGNQQGDRSARAATGAPAGKRRTDRLRRAIFRGRPGEPATCLRRTTRSRWRRRDRFDFQVLRHLAAGDQKRRRPQEENRSAAGCRVFGQGFAGQRIVGKRLACLH